MAIINFPKMEEEILKFWQDNKIFEKTLAKKSPKGNFVFFEGPPTANGKPGLHHIEARAFKDIICRYKTMQGYFVGRKAGWDTHGLPVELQIEKELKISGKPEIEKYGIEAFNKKCKESVWHYKEEWEKMTERIAFWLDLKHPYITYENYYIESLWWILKQIWDKGLLYEGHKVVPQCPRCGTALSSHEVALGYKETVDQSVYVKFEILDSEKIKFPENTYFLVWTTTPWTLPGNMGLAVGKDITYVQINVGKENYILSKNAAEQLFDNNLVAEAKEYKGEQFEGCKYYTLFDDEADKELFEYLQTHIHDPKPSILQSESKVYNVFQVHVAKFVSDAEGTGIVHIAPMYGEDDFEFGWRHGLPLFHTVDENGKFLVSPWKNKFVKDPKVEEEVVDFLDKNNLLFYRNGRPTFSYEHDYPFCWRCGTPLLYYAKRSWFIKMSDAKIKENLIKNNQEINWVPEYIKEGRFGEWLREVKDWALSRERYWGTPLPIWRCKGKLKVKGEKLKVDCDNTLVVGSIEELEKLSGKDLKNLDLHRPFVDEVTFKCKKCGGQMRRVPEVLDCWFDSGSMPFAQWHYPFENKKKIDKGEQFPADYISEAIDQTRGWFYTLLAVSTLLDQGAPYKNVICLGHLRDAKGEKMSKSKGNIVDPWDVINRYGSDAARWYFYTINQPGDPKNFNLADVDAVLKKFFLILFNVLSFYKLYTKEKPGKTKSPSHILDKWILAKLNLLIKITTGKLNNYDVVGAARDIAEFVNELSTWYVRRSRERFKEEGEDKEAAIYILYFILYTLAKLIAPFTPFNAEKIYQELDGKKESVHLEDWPEVDKKLIDEKIINQMNVARKIVEAGLAARATAGIKIRQPLASYSTSLVKKLESEYIEIIKDELNVLELKFGEDKLDMEITDELKAQGAVREIVRSTNALRKEAGLTITDHITLHYETENPFLENVFKNFEEKIKKETLSGEVRKGRAESAHQKEIDINGGLWLGIQKI